MILHDTALRSLAGKIFPSDAYVGPSSVDFRLSRSFSRLDPHRGSINLERECDHQAIEVSGDQFVLEPHGFILGSTEETISLPAEMAAIVCGRSSIGRLGLQIQNAGFIDAGFRGQITLELANQTPYPIEIPIGIRICQVVFFWQEGKSERPYSGKYHGQVGATASRAHFDTDRLR
jgi:dCTP deaminase